MNKPLSLHDNHNKKRLNKNKKLKAIAKINNKTLINHIERSSLITNKIHSKYIVFI